MVEHYISCARESDATRVRHLAEAEGFAVQVDKPTRRRWVVTVAHRATPSPVYQWRMTRKWRKVAATLDDGHYDGWGTEWGYEDPPGWNPPD